MSASLFAGLFSRHIEERAIVSSTPQSSLTAQIAIFSGISFGSDNVTNETAGCSVAAHLPSLNDSMVVSATPPDSSYLDALACQRSSIIEYTVQEGDLLSFIASDFGVSVDSIMQANNLKNANSISPGKLLRIPPISGIIYKVKKGDTTASVAKKHAAEEPKIIAFNHLPLDGTLMPGQEIMIPEDSIQPVEISSFMASNAVSDATPHIAFYGTTSPATLAKYAYVFDHLPDMDEYFKEPASGYDRGLLHGRNGVDISNTCGTSIYAAAGGIVTVADAVGYNGGFGKYIKISHSNATETLYAHASKLLVTDGQMVAQGDQIALMGATGYATGCHLHFEVHGAHNPLAKE